MTGTEKPPLGGWVVVLSMRDGRDPSLIHTPQELLAVARTWHFMRKLRGEPRPETFNGYISAAAGSGDTFILHGVSKYDFETTKQALDELATCIGLVFNLDTMEVVAGDERYVMTKKSSHTPNQQD